MTGNTCARDSFRAAPGPCQTEARTPLQPEPPDSSPREKSLRFQEIRSFALLIRISMREKAYRWNSTSRFHYATSQSIGLLKSRQFPLRGAQSVKRPRRTRSDLHRGGPMTYIEETVTAGDGLRLFQRRREAAKPKAEILITHGFGEHSGRYDALAEHLISRGFSTAVYDHRGHGLSDGLPGHVESFAEYDDDLAKVIELARERAGSLPVFLIGHSMRGLIALRYAARKGEQLAGVVVSAPLIAVAVSVPAYKTMIA